MDLRQILILFLTFLFLPQALASGPLEPAIAGNNQCLQAGLVDWGQWPEEYKKYNRNWAWLDKGYLVTMADCSQSDQQDWQVDETEISGSGGRLAVMRYGKKFVPVVSHYKFRNKFRKKLLPLRLDQGRLVFRFRKKDFCLIADGGAKFSAHPLDECLSTPDLSAASRWMFDLPPDPGEAGLVGLDGIDSDQDGVRDDVQRFIEVEMPVSEVIRKAIRELAVISQKELTNAYNKEMVLAMGAESEAAVDCFLYRTDGDPENNLERLQARLFNTLERLKAWSKVNSYFSGMTFTVPDDLEAQCDFDVEAKK
ncbi:MAG: hypothetical protein ACR2PT_01275 [Endozoicomonas sp.]